MVLTEPLVQYAMLIADLVGVSTGINVILASLLQEFGIMI